MLFNICSNINISSIDETLLMIRKEDWEGDSVVQDAILQHGPTQAIDADFHTVIAAVTASGAPSSQSALGSAHEEGTGRKQGGPEDKVSYNEAPTMFSRIPWEALRWDGPWCCPKLKKGAAFAPCKASRWRQPWKEV